MTRRDHKVTNEDGALSGRQRATCGAEPSVEYDEFEPWSNL